MKIDYDGLQYDRECDYSYYTREMLEALLEAMREGEVTYARITYAWVICDTCEGSGSNSRHLGVIDPDTWNDWDDDARESYLGGHYDRECESCGGSGKAKEMNYDILPADVQGWIDDYLQRASDYAYERYCERLAGC
jgi:DnaJ-class molecular chaperone